MWWLYPKGQADSRVGAREWIGKLVSAPDRFHTTFLKANDLAWRPRDFGHPFVVSGIG